MTLPRVPDPVLGDLERIALGVASEAALLVAQRASAEVSATKSTPTDVVTDTDRRSQELIAQRLRAVRPDDAFYAEEDGALTGTTGLTWVVDPIDGTVNFVYDIPAYAVSVAAVVGNPRQPGQWAPVAAAVVNPVSGERFWARSGGGAWRQRGRLPATRLAVSVRDELAFALIGTGFGYAAHVRAWQARLLAPLLPQVRDIRRAGSAALDLCHVADASLDGFYERGLNAWDLAAGWLIVTEAGGAVTGLHEPDPSAEMTIAGGAIAPVLREALVTIIDEIGPLDGHHVSPAEPGT